MRPANTGICTGNNNVLAGVPKRPDLWRVRIIDSWFDRGWPRRRFLNRAWLRQVVMNNWVAFDASHPRERRQCLSDLAITLHQNCVNDIERLILNFAFVQPLQNGRLRGLALAQQHLIHVAALFSLGRQTSRAAQVSLIGQYNEKFSLLTVGGVLHHPRRNLLVKRVNALARRLAAARRSTGAR